jgi:predicted protein tyrosine phosphatase
MFFPFLNRHLNICAQADLPRIGRRDPGFWHVVSIREPQRPLPDFRPFRSCHTVICYDIVGTEGLAPEELVFAPNHRHLAGIFDFADERPGQPLLIHCWAGQSRSTAVALALMVRAMHLEGRSSEEIAQEAIPQLLEIRQCAAPNPLVLRLGLDEFLDHELAAVLAGLLLNHPAIFSNYYPGASPCPG